MSDEQSSVKTGAHAVRDTFVLCDSCDAPVVLQAHPTKGYRLVCGCPQQAFDLDNTPSKSLLFEPLSGRWSQIDDPDWDWK